MDWQREYIFGGICELFTCYICFSTFELSLLLLIFMIFHLFNLIFIWITRFCHVYMILFEHLSHLRFTFPLRGEATSVINIIYITDAPVHVGFHNLMCIQYQCEFWYMECFLVHADQAVQQSQVPTVCFLMLSIFVIAIFFIFIIIVVLFIFS